MNPTYASAIGFLLGLGSVLLLRRLYPYRDHLVWRTALIIAALIYVGFVIVAGELAHFAVELTGVIIYGTFAWLSKKYGLYWLALGWALHICWDVLLHSPHKTPYVPEFYPGLCMGFDIVIAIYICFLIRERKSLHPSIKQFN